MGRRWLTLALTAAMLAGCGATPPQAPGPQAHQLNTSLSAISSACGHATEIQALTNNARDMTITEHQAQKQVPTLAHIYKQNKNWIFQGKTVAELVQMTGSYLDECGLHKAAQQLRRQASAG